MRLPLNIMTARGCPRLGKTFCCFILCASLLTFVGVQVFLMINDPLRMSRNSVDATRTENVDFRRNLASQLAHITRSLKTSNPSVNADLLLNLNNIIGQLDSRQALANSDLLPPPDGQEPDTCGEDFKGTLHGYPWYRVGFVPSISCKKKPDIGQLVTAVFLDSGHPRTLDTILKGVRNTHPNLPVVFASTKKPKTSLDKFTQGFTVTDKELQFPGKIWNSLIDIVKTPYVLLGRNITYFNSLVRLERQIYVISSMNAVEVVGGAFRNESGHWKVGCHLSNIRNYLLKYTEGYQYSAMDCMFCDLLEGPFVIKSTVFQNIKFKEELPREVIFEDWFLRVKQAGILAMNCPDVMYFTQGLVEEQWEGKNREKWLPLAQEWQVVRVITPSGTRFNFSCPELGLTCDATKWYRALLIPTCCLEQVAGALKALDRFTKESNLDYEIEAGTLLGAVKLRSFLPWDMDGDITFQFKDYQKFYDNSDVFAKQGFSLSNFKSKEYFRLNTPAIMLEMWGSDEMSTLNLPTVMWETPTLVKMMGVWLRGEWNPGLFARNRYGPDYLKHVQHWGTLGMSDSWVKYKPGSWLGCPKVAHHACLDQYPADGSIGLVPEE